jgi:conjugal transfer mating pair stabilization protein TraG
MHDLPIYVYGAGSLFAEFFNAIPAAMGSSTFSTLLRISALLSGVTAIASGIFKRDFLSCVRWFGLYYLVFYVIFLPKVDVVIIDRIDSRHYAVSNVPLGLGVLASVTTSIGDALTRLTDEIFSMPDDLGYSKSGMVMASKMALASRQFQIIDSRLNGNMERFMVQCVYWPILLGYYTMDDLTSATNLWEFISTHAPKSRSFLYDGGTLNSRKITMCNAGVTQLGNDLKANMDIAGIRGSSRIFTGSKNLNTARGTSASATTRTSEEIKAQLLKYLPQAYSYLLNISGSATDILQQSVMANAVRNGLLYFGTSTNSQTAIANYAATRAQEQQRLTQNTLGFLAGYWLPITKNAFEAIMYGCFLFVVLLGIFPFGVSVLRNYAFTLCWLQAWAPLYAIINLICSYYARIQSLSIQETGFVLKNWYQFLQINHDMASLAGYLTLSVPFISAGLVKGMAGTMTQVAQYMGGVSQSVGSQAASEAVAGNISMGVTGMRNNSAFNLNNHQHDLAARMSSGVSYELPGGESLNFMPDGGIALSRGRTISDLGVNIDFASSIQNAATKQADYSYNTAKSESIAAGENYNAGMRSLYELANHAGTSAASGKSWVASDSTSVGNALNKVQDLTQQFSQKHDISYDHAKEILTRANAGLGVSVGANASGGSSGGGVGSSAGLKAEAGVERIITNNDTAKEQKLYSYAEDYVKKTGYSESIDFVQRAAIDRSLHTTNEKGARLVESMTGSFEKASHLRKESETHFQEAEGYRRAASYSQEHGIQIRENANQEFVKFVTTQPNVMRGGGTMSAQNVLNLISRDSEFRQTALEHFSQNYVKSNLSNWNQGMASSQQAIKHTYQNNASSISSQGNQELQKQQVANKEQVQTNAEQKGLLKENFIDTSVKDVAEGRFKNNQHAIQQTKDKLDTAELIKENKFNEEKDAAKQFRNGVIIDALKSDKTRHGLIGAFIADKTPREKIEDKIDE